MPLKPCNAFVRPDRKTVKMLKETGDVGLRILRDKDTKEPVFWLWQTFTVIRLNMQQAKELAAEIESRCSRYARKSGSKSRRKTTR